MKQQVIGQTGTIVLSDDAIYNKLDRKRTVRYRYKKCAGGYRAEVVGPFHSRLYGTTSWGTSHKRAKESLSRRLSNNFAYHGVLLYSVEDSADNVGRIDPRLLDDNMTVRPITYRELCGSAGQ